MRRLPLLSAILLLGAVVPIVASVFTQRWVVERRGDHRVVLGPHQLVTCDGERCERVAYDVRIARLQAQLQDPARGALERERIAAAVDRMRYNRKKGLQITIPGLVAAAFFGVIGVVLLVRRRAGPSHWTRGSVRFVTCGIALGLAVFALVYVEGMSHLPAEGASSRYGSAFYLMLLGSLSAFTGGILAGVRDPVV